jgi:predicted nucleic acid-binding protein
MLPLALMRRALFSDTSFLYAQADEADSDHLLVVSVIEEVLQQKRPIVVTTFIIAETHALILRRLGRDLAASWLQQAYESFIVIRPTEEDERRACEIIFGYTDKDFSFTDAISFAVMERLGITVALSLDEHFVQFGKFTVVPLQTEKLG